MAHLAEGLDRLFAFLQEGSQRIELNDFLNAPNRDQWVPTVAHHRFPDGVWFELCLVSEEDSGYHFWLKWVRSDPEPGRTQIFDVHVFFPPRKGPRSEDLDAVINRTIRRLLDPFALARLFLPAKFSETEVLGMLAQLALLACRNGSLITRNDTGKGPASVFRRYVDRIAHRYFKDYQGKPLDEVARDEITDTVFQRLYLNAQPGQGFMATARAATFPAYILKAIRGAVSNYNQQSRVKGRSIESYEADQHDPRRRRTSTKSIPASPQQAAESLGVSHSTAWRKMKATGGKELTADEWALMQKQAADKKAWHRVKRELETRGRKSEAARRQVYRWRKQGLSPEQAVRLIKGEDATDQGSGAEECSACKAPAKAESSGKWYCMECYQELFGIPGNERSE